MVASNKDTRILVVGEGGRIDFDTSAEQIAKVVRQYPKGPEYDQDSLVSIIGEAFDIRWRLDDTDISKFFDGDDMDMEKFYGEDILKKRILSAVTCYVGRSSAYIKGAKREPPANTYVVGSFRARGEGYGTFVIPNRTSTNERPGNIIAAALIPRLKQLDGVFADDSHYCYYAKSARELAEKILSIEPDADIIAVPPPVPY